VRRLACGLAHAGVQRGDHLVVVGDNRPRLYATLLATQALGAVPVPLYQDAAATEYAFPINNAEVKFAIVEDQEQVDKMLEIRERCPQLSHIYYDEPRGLRNYAQPGLGALSALMEAVEFAAADAACSPWRRLSTSVGELAAQFGGGLRLVDFAPLYGRRVEAGQRITAVACERLGGAGGPVALPAELVFVPWDGDAGGPLFGWSSNGLASGNTVEEATVHALFEVMERDTLAMNRAADASLAIDPATLPEPYPTLAARWRAQGVELAVRWLPGAFGLPCFAAWLHERHSEDVDIAGGARAALHCAAAFAGACNHEVPAPRHCRLPAAGLRARAAGPAAGAAARARFCRRVPASLRAGSQGLVGGEGGGAALREHRTRRAPRRPAPAGKGAGPCLKPCSLPGRRPTACRPARWLPRR